MKRRVLPLLNTLGCVVLATIAITQWQRERRLDHQLDVLQAELVSTQEKYDAESARAKALDLDVASLKESIESNQAAALETQKLLEERDAQAHAMAGEINKANEQFKIWETAIAERDERIAQLHSNLAATRKRLDDAIARLKEAAAAAKKQ